jgi:hypothetical protein
MRRFAKSVTGVTWSAGSNPVLSATENEAVASDFIGRTCDGLLSFLPVLSLALCRRSTILIKLPAQEIDSQSIGRGQFHLRQVRSTCASEQILAIGVAVRQDPSRLPDLPTWR